MPDDNNKSSEVTFTGAETKFLLCALKHLQGGVNFDADAVAAELGHKDGTIAKVRWNSINRTKIQAAASPSGVKKTPASKKSSKKAAKDDDAEVGMENTGEGTLSKAPKKRGLPSKQAKEEPQVKVKDEEVEDALDSIE